MNKIIEIEINKIDENYSYFKIKYINEEKFDNLIYKNNRIWIKKNTIFIEIFTIFFICLKTQKFIIFQLVQWKKIKTDQQ